MSGNSFSPRTVWLILADAAIIYGGVVLALYLRLGSYGVDNELNARNAARPNARRRSQSIRRRDERNAL